MFDTLLTDVEQNIKVRKKDYDQLSEVYAEAVTASHVSKEDLAVADLHFVDARREREKILEEFKKKVFNHCSIYSLCRLHKYSGTGIIRSSPSECGLDRFHCITGDNYCIIRDIFRGLCQV